MTNQVVELRTEAHRRHLIRHLETARLKTDNGAGLTCALCQRRIELGELYAIKGPMYAHYVCVPGLGRNRERWQREDVDYAFHDTPTDERPGLRRFAGGEDWED